MNYLVVILCTLFAIHSVHAHAACGWILWDDYYSGGSGPALQEKRTIDGFSSAEECQKRKDIMISSYKKQKKDSPGYKTIVEINNNTVRLEYYRVEENKAFSITIHDFKCLPDNVSPK